MRTIKLTIAYDGTEYVGWQRQDTGPSIQGCIEEALSTHSLRVALRPAARAIYWRARVQSLPAYLPALLLFAASWLAPWPLTLPLIWLALSALCYAHLVVVQLYVAAHAEAHWA